MTEVALLNPQEENAVAKKFIDVVTMRIGQLTTDLTTSVLDREAYLLKIGAVKELEQIQTELQREYDRTFMV